MKNTAQRLLFAVSVLLSLPVPAAESAENLSVLADPKGHWGASDASGAVIIPFQYDYAERLGEGFVLVGRRVPKTDQKTAFGVFNAQGKPIIPLKYSHIEFNRKLKRFKVTTEDSPSKYKQGYFDEHGKVLIPVIYDALTRISNDGSEPTALAKRNGKYGYINIESGKIMIPVEYAALYVDSLMTDAQGKGIAIALKNNKRGILSTDGKVLVPFEFDAIGDVTPDRGILAERGGKLVQLNFKNGDYTGTSEVTTEYSSNFVPRPMASINPAPFDGLYVAEDYPTMKSAWDAWKAGTLRWIAIPSLQVNGKQAYVSFGLFAKSGLPLLRNVLDVTRSAEGFALMTEADDPEAGQRASKEFLSFKEEQGRMVCAQCAEWNLPVRWRLLPAEKPQEFGGIGVAIKRLRTDDSGVTVLDVLDNGPASKAGLQAGDVITHIDGNAVAEDSMEQARDKLRGKAGTHVRLSVVRNGNPLPEEIVVERAIVAIR